jgi:hypothetical protein
MASKQAGLLECRFGRQSTHQLILNS